MRREEGEEIDIYFIIYFKCLHLCVVPSLNRNIALKVPLSHFLLKKFTIILLFCFQSDV